MSDFYIKKITLKFWDSQDLQRAWGLFWIRPDGKHQWMHSNRNYIIIREDFLRYSLNPPTCRAVSISRNEIGEAEWIRSRVQFGWD